MTYPAGAGVSSVFSRSDGVEQNDCKYRVSAAHHELFTESKVPHYEQDY